MCNTYCFSTATVVARTHLYATSYSRTLPVFVKIHFQILTSSSSSPKWFRPFMFPERNCDEFHWIVTVICSNHPSEQVLTAAERPALPARILARYPSVVWSYSGVFSCSRVLDCNFKYQNDFQVHRHTFVFWTLYNNEKLYSDSLLPLRQNGPPGFWTHPAFYSMAEGVFLKGIKVARARIWPLVFIYLQE